MHLASLISEEKIVLGLKSRILTDAVKEILDRVESFHPDDSISLLLETVLRREEQASTAMERGVAIPHARVPGIREYNLLLGIPETPLETKCYDGTPVELIWLILSNDKKYTLMLHTMSAISTFSKDETQLANLKGADSASSALKIISDSGAKVNKGLFARDLVRESLVKATPDMPLRELLDALFTNRVYEAPVCNEAGQIVGAVTSREIIEAAFPEYMLRIPNLGFLNEYAPFEEFFKREETLTVGEILHDKPFVVDASDPMIQVVLQMTQGRHRLAYVQEDGQFIGVIDRNDIISKILRV